MPMPPPAPALFSMTIGVLSTRLIASAAGRATISATPPGGNGTTSAIGFDGYTSCACAGKAASIASNETTSAALTEMVMPFLLTRARPSTGGMGLISAAPLRCAPLDEDPVQQSAQDKPLGGVVRELAFTLERFRRKPQVIREAEDLVEHAHVVTGHVLGLARADDGGLVPVIDGGHDAAGQRPLDVTEQDHARLVGLVLGPVYERLVEDDGFTVAPVVRLAIDENAAVFRVRRRKPEVIAQRSRERVAMLAQIASRRQQREHRRVDRGDRLYQRRRLGAQSHGRRQRIVVPL